MALTRLLRFANKSTGSFKYLSNVKSSLLRKQKHIVYDYTCGRHAAAFLHNNHHSKFQTNSEVKPLFDLIESNIKKVSSNDLADLYEESKATFYKAIYSLSFKKNSHLFSNRDGHSSNENNDGSEKPELPGDNPDYNSKNNKIFVIAVLLFIVISEVISRGMRRDTETTSWPSFVRLMLQTGEVERLQVSPQRDAEEDEDAQIHRVDVYLANGAIINGSEVTGFGPHYSFTVGNLQTFEEKLRSAQEELGIKPSEFIPIKYTSPTSPSRTLATLALYGVVGLILWTVMRKGGSSSKSGGIFRQNPFSSHTRAKTLVILPGSRKGIGFKDVAGMQEAKEEVKEFVDYLQYPARFKELGAKIPRGALLCGPPGTGKTLLAKAVSTEAAVPFISMAGSDFVETYSGVGSARVRDLFAQARKHAPCIVYIDEIDAIGRSRRSSQSFGGNSEQENTLNQLLVEMDGMNTVEGVVMLASTNRPDILDQALLRPGRFDRNIEIDIPTLPERKDIFTIYLKQLKLGQGLHVYAKRLAELTPGKSGADIANICNEAALHAARLNEKNVDEKNFDYAIERVIAGMHKNNNPLSPEERNVIAYHEAGHVIVSWMLKHTEPVMKISTVPRVNSPFGFTQKFPLDIKLHTNEQLHDIMCTLLGGRLAESLVFGKITTSAEDDLKRVTEMAYKQIALFGMNERIGPLSFPPKRKGEYSKKPYSDKLAREIDEEASLMIKNAINVANEILQDNRDKVDALAEALLEKEVLKYDDLVDLIGQSPHGDKMQNYYDNQVLS